MFGLALHLTTMCNLYCLQASQEDIEKSFGGGSFNTYYSAAYSSSTNAYMLMYRQIDKVRNMSAIKKNEYPEHIVVSIKLIF